MKMLYLPNQYSQQRQREKARWIYPVHLAMEAEYYRRLGHDVYWDHPEIACCMDKIVTQPEGLRFTLLPHADRIFTHAFDKKYQNNGNFKYRPGTYIQAANGCWHGKCTFCVERDIPYEVREVEDVIEEIRECKAMGFREIFDDSGTFPTGGWLDRFCDRLAAISGVSLGCNMRLVDCDYVKLRRSGFRMLLFGLESANQKTLDRINKGISEYDYRYIVKAAVAGLDCHVAVMFGYPGETDQDALNTLRLVWRLLKKGYAKTAQASFYMPLDGQNNPAHRKYVKQIYKVAWYPEFWINKLMDISDIDDIKYLWRMIKEGLSCGTR